MSILDYRPQELAEHRKRVSDLKNDTDALTFVNPNKPSSHGDAARKVRNIKDDIEIIKLSYDDLEEYDPYD